MSWYTKEKYKCEKCGYVFEFDVDTLVIAIGRKPKCPKCGSTHFEYLKSHDNLNEMTKIIFGNIKKDLQYK